MVGRQRKGAGCEVDGGDVAGEQAFDGLAHLVARCRSRHQARRLNDGQQFFLHAVAPLGIEFSRLDTQADIAVLPPMLADAEQVDGFGGSSDAVHENSYEA
ncbi:MAG: hypothetical protein B7Y42_00595 [Polaromonas sp. 28-63-22]|nr:MAG: hypothetical protein B7Y42_00595 [Polaromonas sp. 28-63-22]